MTAVEPSAALNFYRGNVEEFEQPAPVILLIGETVLPVILDLPTEDMAERVAPDLIRKMLPTVTAETGPLSQVLFSVEAELMNVNKPFAGKYPGVVIYSVGAEEYRLVAPFRREPDGVVFWREDIFEVVAGPALDRDDVILAMRWLMEQSQ